MVGYLRFHCTNKLTTSPAGQQHMLVARELDKSESPGCRLSPEARKMQAVYERHMPSEPAPGQSWVQFEGTHFADALAVIGDVDGNGINDIAVGDYLENDCARYAGALYIALVRQNGAVAGGKKLILQPNGTISSNRRAYSWGGGCQTTPRECLMDFAKQVAGVGDVNGDGVPDVVTTIYNFTSRRDALLLLFLSPSGEVKSDAAIDQPRGC